MGDIRGGKKKYELIPAPVGKKIIGTVIEVSKSQKIDDYLSIKVEFPQFFKELDNGKRFCKQAYYGVPIDWSEKNKAGVLLQNLMGRLPEEEEEVNWTKLLLGKKVACILENVMDKNSGEVTGHKISWMGKPNASSTSEPEEEPPFDREPGDEEPEHIP